MQGIMLTLPQMIQLPGRMGIVLSQWFVKPGEWLWKCPGPDTEVHAICISGGGAGGTTYITTNSYPAGDGEPSSFGSLLTANGGKAGQSRQYQQSSFFRLAHPYPSYPGRNNGTWGTNRLYWNQNRHQGGKGGQGIMGFGAGGDAAWKWQASASTSCGGKSGEIKTGDFIVSEDQIVIVGAGGQAGGFANNASWPHSGEGQAGAVFVYAVCFDPEYIRKEMGAYV